MLIATIQFKPTAPVKPESITLCAFEEIQDLIGLILGVDFMTCENPRLYIHNSNRLFDACIEATSYSYAASFPSALDCAVELVTAGLSGTIEVVDEIAEMEAA